MSETTDNFGNPFQIRFLAFSVETLTDQVAFLNLREPNGFTTQELPDELEKLKAHDFLGEAHFQMPSNEWKLWEITIPNEWDFRKIESLAKLLEADPTTYFAFSPVGTAPQIEIDHNCHP